MTAEADWLDDPEVQAALAGRDARAGFNPESLAESIRMARYVAEDLDQAAMGLSELPWTDAASMLADLRTARETVQRIERALEVQTARSMLAAGVKQQPLDGVGVVEWHRGRERKQWDHEAAAGDVLDALLASDPDGVPPTPWEVRDALLGAGHVDYWRVKALKDRGLDPDDYCVSLPGRVSVQIVRPD